MAPPRSRELKLTANTQNEGSAPWSACSRAKKYVRTHIKSLGLYYAGTQSSAVQTSTVTNYANEI